MKKAFSLAEILVSMMILSVLFLAGSKVLTQPRKDEISKKIHGVYECYYDNGVLKEAMSRTGEPVEGTAPLNGCVFTPARDSSMYCITVIFGDRKGEETFSTFINTQSMSIQPPKAGENGNNNTATFIVDGIAPKNMSPQEDAPTISDDEYKIMVNKVLTYGRNVHVDDANVKAGDTNKPGAVIITW